MAKNGTKTVKSADPKVNADSVAQRIAKRALNTNVEVVDDVPRPERKPKSKYSHAFEALTDEKKSFFLEECSPGNAAAVKAAAKRIYGYRLYAAPEGTGYRFWRIMPKAAPKPAENASEATEANTNDNQAAA